MITIFALLGVKALYFTLIWLFSSVVAGYLSERKGYGDKPGLAAGLLLTVIGPLIWLVVPAKEGSRWKKLGPFGNTPRSA